MSRQSRRKETAAARTDEPVACYIRVSSREQAEGYSIEAQKLACLEHVRKLGLKLAHPPFVEIESAKGPNDRPVFDQMVKFLSRNPSVRGIVAHKLDRIARNFSDTGLLLEKLKLKPYLVEQEIPPGPAGAFYLHILGAQARFYIENLRTEVIKGLGQQFKEGHTPFKAPHGYIQRRDEAGRSLPPRLDPKRREGLLQVFLDAATANYTLDQLRDRAFRRGYRYSPRVAKIPRSTLETILKNPYYCGEIHYRGDVNKNGKHEALVSRDLFDRVQEAITRTPQGYGKPSIPFSGLLRCQCGRSLTGEAKTKKVAGESKTYTYYRCARYGDCGGERLNLAQLEEQFAFVLKRLESWAAPAELLQKAWAYARRSETEAHNRSISEWEDRVRVARGKLDALLDEKLVGKLTDKDFDRAQDRLRGEMREAEEQVRALQEAKPETTFGFATALLRKAHALWLAQGQEEREALLRLLCRTYVLDGRKVEPVWRAPFDLELRRTDI